MEKFFKIYDAVLRWTMTIFFLIMIILLFGQVISRYFLDFPIMWAEEIGRYLFIWIVYIGASQAFLTGNHLRVDFVFNKFTPSIRKYLNLFLYLLIIVFLFVVFLYGSRYTLMNYDKTAYSVNWVNLGWSYSAVPLGAFLMIINIIRTIPVMLSGSDISNQ